MNTPTTGTPLTDAPFAHRDFRTFPEKEVRYFLFDLDGEEWDGFKGGVDARRAAQWVRGMRKLAEAEGRPVPAVRDLIEYEVIEHEVRSKACSNCGVRPVAWEWDCDGKFPMTRCEVCMGRHFEEPLKGYHARRVFHAGGWREEPWHVARKHGQQDY